MQPDDRDVLPRPNRLKQIQMHHPNGGLLCSRQNDAPTPDSPEHHSHQHRQETLVVTATPGTGIS